MHTNLVVFFCVFIAVDTINFISSKSVRDRIIMFPIYAWAIFTFLTVIGVIK